MEPPIGQALIRSVVERFLYRWAYYCQNGNFQETLDIKNTYYFHNSKDEVIGAMEDVETTSASASAVQGSMNGLHPFPTVNGMKPGTTRTINKVYLFPTPRPLSFPVTVFEEPEPESQYMMSGVSKESYGRHNYAGSRQYRVNLGDSYASIAEK